MKNQGVERMDIQPGDEFDPNVHEAITQEENPDYQEGQIIEVVQPGYKISGPYYPSRYGAGRPIESGGKKKMGKIIGIDLGTTNSVAAVMSGGEPVVIPSAEGERLVPSVVAVNKNGERLVGRVARNQAITNPENTHLLHQAFHGP